MLVSTQRCACAQYPRKNKRISLCTPTHCMTKRLRLSSSPRWGDNSQGMYYSEHDFIVPLTTTCSVDELKAFKKPPQIPSKDSLLSRAAAARTERQETLNALFDFHLIQTQRLDEARIIS